MLSNEGAVPIARRKRGMVVKRQSQRRSVWPKCIRRRHIGTCRWLRMCHTCVHIGLPVPPRPSTGTGACTTQSAQCKLTKAKSAYKKSLSATRVKKSGTRSSPSCTPSGYNQHDTSYSRQRQLTKSRSLTTVYSCPVTGCTAMPTGFRRP